MKKLFGHLGTCQENCVSFKGNMFRISSEVFFSSEIVEHNSIQGRSYRKRGAVMEKGIKEPFLEPILKATKSVFDMMTGLEVKKIRYLYQYCFKIIF